MEVIITSMVWVMTILVPIHGLLFLGIRNERQKNMRILLIRGRLENRRRHR